MKVKVKCCKCNKKHYIKAYSFRDAKSKKKPIGRGVLFVENALDIN